MVRLHGFRVCILLLGLLNVKISGKSIGVETSTELQVDLQDFLIKNGYLQLDGNEQATQAQLTKAIQDFQEFMRIEVTGILDEATINLMNDRNCPFPDKQPKETPDGAIRQGRYSYSGQKWEETNIRWNVNVVEGLFSRSQVTAVVTRALDDWANPTLITFPNESSRTFEIGIDFVIPDPEGNHGSDGNPFSTSDLGHAYYPGTDSSLDGDMHINMRQDYYISTNDEYNPIAYDLVFTVVHELGHSLGLDHSGSAAAVMYPTFKRGNNYAGLHPDDINGIQFIYGANPSSSGSHRNILEVYLALTSFLAGFIVTNWPIFHNIM